MITPIPTNLLRYFQNIQLPDAHSHKGQNGKLLLIGGSELFHAASRWSLDVASKFVDMVFYSSVPSNNELIQAAKSEFWDGIVVPREELENYLDEADAILIGPGMTRTPDTAELVNDLLKKYPTKKWVVDAGALQMVDQSLLTASMILTPHFRELEYLLKNAINRENFEESPELARLLQTHATVLLKGEIDLIFSGDQRIEVTGGNSGMTKGGTGDVLAGLVAALYCRHDSLTAAVVGSFANKAAGDELFIDVGPFFNASDLVEQIPKTMWQLLTSNSKS